MRIDYFIPLIILSFMSIKGYAREEVNLYIYHNKPPFIVDHQKEQGLYFDLATYLTQRSSTYEFSATYMPRKRIDHMINNNTLDGVVMGVSPVWFGDKDETKYLWLPAFYADKDEFISLKPSPFEYQNKDSLINKSIATVAGYYYFNINEAVEQGHLSRINTVGELQVLELIKMSRADMGLVSRSTFNYYKKHKKIDDIFHVSAIPHDSFERRAFTTKDNVKVHAELSRLLTSIQSDSNWQKLLSEYE